MTTEHVSVPRELFDMAREQIERQRLAALEYGLIAVAEAHSYALHKIDAILSRATPSESDLAIHMDRDAWRAAMIGLCHGAMSDVGTPDKAADHLRKRLAKAKPSAPRVVTAELSNTIAGDIAEHLRDKGWSSGGNYQDDFLPDVEIATRAALESFATSLPAAIPPGHVVVPVESVDEQRMQMMEAWDEAQQKAKKEGKKITWPEMMGIIYSAAIAAAPQAGERG